MRLAGRLLHPFTRFTTYAELVIPAGTNVEAARKLLEQAEHRCLIANALQGARSLEAQVDPTASHET